jgi:hypothetical protein
MQIRMRTFQPGAQRAGNHHMRGLFGLMRLPNWQRIRTFRKFSGCHRSASKSTRYRAQTPCLAVLDHVEQREEKMDK